MSILNVWVTPTRGVVTVDSLGTGVKGVSAVFKVAALPQAVMAVRGTAGLLGQAVNMAQRCTGLQHILTALDESLPQIVQLLRDEGKFQGIKNAVGPVQQLALVGWSDAEQRVIGYLWEMKGPKSFKRSEIRKAFIGMVDEIGQDPAMHEMPATEDAMLDIARRQVVWARGERPDLHIGGRMFLAEVNSTGCSIKGFGEL